MPSVYELVRPHIRTGDVVLSSGSGPFSGWIKAAQGCPWSHAAIAYIDKQGNVALWESGGGKVGLGDLDAMLRPKAAWNGIGRMFNRFYGQGPICVRHLLNVERNDAFYADFEFFRTWNEGKPYEENLWELAKATLGEWGNTEEALDSIFCSELVAATYKHLKLLPDDRPSNSYRPWDFSGEAKLKLLRRASFGPEILLADWHED